MRSKLEDGTRSTHGSVYIGRGETGDEDDIPNA